MMFLLLIYQRMVSSSSRAIFVSLSRRLELLLARRRQLAGGLDEPDGEDEEPSLDQLEELAAEEQLARLEQHVQSGAIRQIRPGNGDQSLAAVRCPGEAGPWAATTPNL